MVVNYNPRFMREAKEESIHKWLSPPDPSTNHNIACATHQKSTAAWFFQGSIFQAWKRRASLLWIYGKRAPFHSFANTSVLRCIAFVAGSGKSVLWFVDPFVIPFRVTDIVCQFHNH